MEVLKAALRHWNREAVLFDRASYRYRDLVAGAFRTAALVPETNKAADHENGPRVAILAPPGRHFVQGLWGAWLAGGIAVPLCLKHPARELQYVLRDAQVSTLLATEQLQGKGVELAAEAACHCKVIDDSDIDLNDYEARLHNEVGSCTPTRGALLLYTSGTTGQPKGVLHSHGGLAAMTGALREAWDWRADDLLLHALPLHHIHGLVVALLCAHAAGACVDFLPSFSPSAVWSALQRRDKPVTMFMGVPTMYDYLLNEHDKMDPARQEAASAAAARLRLTVSGSAACPLSVMERWKRLSGQTLLERYGMTETGMILSNPLEGERRPGSVGLPLPGVLVKADAPRDTDSDSDGQMAGQELLVGGPAVFREYWNRPDATAEAFSADGLFRTGDTAVLEGEPPYWRILGRTSVDIIKSGGYKISALGIENVLLRHPAVAECAVLGPPHASLGQTIVAVTACRPGSTVTEAQLLDYARESLPSYQMPRHIVFVDAIPRNAMGKINKKQLCRDLLAGNANGF